QAELDQILAGRLPTVADTPNLPYTRMVIEESMRLYPPAWITNRTALVDDEICGYHIPAGSYVAVSPYVTQRDPALWPDPERFDPGRFAPERSAERPRFAYFPFGGGPHQCIGQGFALLEAALVLATVLQRYALELVPDHPLELHASVTLRPRDGLKMRIRER
ncbi:MAG TPA: cytochrome P450, partial [Burkholderiaceae bacterium]|nr:cytochrome P450 [Burkholderiaceae bacterium]